MGADSSTQEETHRAAISKIMPVEERSLIRAIARSMRPAGQVLLTLDNREYPF